LSDYKGSIAEGLLDKLQAIAEKHLELNDRLADPEVACNPDEYRRYAQESAEIAEVVETFSAYQSALAQIADALELKRSDDAEMRELAELELAELTESEASLALALKGLLVPRDPHDTNNAFLEIRAGTGGDEAALFAGDLLRAYTRYGESRRWRFERVSSSPSDAGGYKEVVVTVSGQEVYRRLKYEAGVDRVQRVPAT